jgi:hypothetical protein
MEHSPETTALQRSAGAKGNGPVNGADVNVLVGKSNVNRTRRTIEQEVPSAGASLFAYFFGVEKSKASGGTRPAGFA